jgi:hypothetical protein
MKRPYYSTFISFDVTDNKGFKPKRMSRNNNYRQGNEPGFRCSKCGDSFKEKYGVFGKFRTFEQPSLYCLDCSEKSTFVKM